MYRTVAQANAGSVLGSHRGDRAREAFRSDLDYLTEGDRAVIRAVTGELIQPGQMPHDRPLSAFAMQVAVDRRSGALPAHEPITIGYLQRTRDRLVALQVPANPFAGPNFTKAVAYVSSRAL